MYQYRLFCGHRNKAVCIILCTYKCRINPSAVLDFLWACLHKPCLWQERVKKEAVVNSYLSLVSHFIMYMYVHV